MFNQVIMSTEMEVRSDRTLDLLSMSLPSLSTPVGDNVSSTCTLRQRTCDHRGTQFSTPTRQNVCQSGGKLTFIHQRPRPSSNVRDEQVLTKATYTTPTTDASGTRKARQLDSSEFERDNYFRGNFRKSDPFKCTLTRTHSTLPFSNKTLEVLPEESSTFSEKTLIFDTNSSQNELVDKTHDCLLQSCINTTYPTDTTTNDDICQEQPPFCVTLYKRKQLLGIGDVTAMKKDVDLPEDNHDSSVPSLFFSTGHEMETNARPKQLCDHSTTMTLSSISQESNSKQTGKVEPTLHKLPTSNRQSTEIKLNEGKSCNVRPSNMKLIVSSENTYQFTNQKVCGIYVLMYYILWPNVLLNNFSQVVLYHPDGLQHICVNLLSVKEMS